MTDSPIAASLNLPAGTELAFDTLLNVCSTLNQPGTSQEMLDNLLLQARRLVKAQAGTVFLVHHDELQFVCCQNDARPDLGVAPKPYELERVALSGTSIPVNDASLAGYVAQHQEPLRIDDAYAIAVNAPYQFKPAYDEATGYRTKSLLVIPLIDRMGDSVGVLQLINKQDSDNDEIGGFTERDQQIALAVASLAAVCIRNARLRDHLRDSHLDTIMRLSTAAEFRDDDTGQHIRRVSFYCETVARNAGCGTDVSQLIIFASPMHDIGKLGIPDAILTKPGPLTREERLTMQDHTTIGGRILHGSDNDIVAMAEEIALSHHEKWDGSGYPRGLKGDAIPLTGRICAVADVFDALTCKRVYKNAFPFEEAVQIIRQGTGTHFDPDIVEAFLSATGEVEIIYEALKD